jgi:PhzF family phenazine biosynthesis protein
MPEVLIRQVDAFTTTPFAGNYAGVVPDGAWLSDAQMLSIAREMNVSETAFILPPSQPEADLRIRWFTPGEEVPLCGHATVASFHLLAEEGRWGMEKAGTYAFRLETKSGLLSVNVEKREGSVEIEFEIPVPSFRVLPAPPDGIMQALGLHASALDPQLPIVAESYLYLPVRGLSDLAAVRPDYSGLADACAEMKVLGVSVLTLETIDPRSAVHSRFFAPGLGVNEDPVTGSANGPLGVYLRRYAVPLRRSVPSSTLADGREVFVGEQGDEVGRPGRVEIRLLTDGSTVRRVWIVGRAVTVLRGTMSV